MKSLPLTRTFCHVWQILVDLIISQLFYIEQTILLMHSKLSQTTLNNNNLKLFKSAIFLRNLMAIGFSFFCIFLLSTILYPNQAHGQNQNVNLGVDDWHRTDQHDGYVTGNGHIYTVGGLGQKLTRSGKSFLRDEQVSLTRLAWINGPLYSVGNLGYGWELLPILNGDEETWNSESVLSPSGNEPFWKVHSESDHLTSEITDIIVQDQPVLLRKVKITLSEDTQPTEVRIFIPVYPDPRNSAPFESWNGEPVENQRPSVSEENLLRVNEELHSIVLEGAPRALWQEISTPIPTDEDYELMFPPRALATTAVSGDPSVHVRVSESGIEVDLGTFLPGTTKEFGIWLVTAADHRDQVISSVLNELANWVERDINQVAEESKSALPEPLIQRTDAQNDPFTTIIQSTSSLARATQAVSGCVLAQPYMYPMCYVRDQLGSFKVFLTQHDYERAYKALTFYIAMQNRYGIQNAYDTTPTPPDPTIWNPEANSMDGHHSVAEVPSIIILMAKDYYEATGDLSKIKPLYDRLAYNLRVQEINENGLLPSPGDESYTNSEQTAPEYRIEMTDSNLLFISAARFMSELADTLGYHDDVVEFKRLESETMNAMMDRLWLPEENHFAYARSANDNPEEIDRRPALDLLLRWFWLDMSDPLDSIPQQNLSAVLNELVDPVRVVPEVYNFTAGMDLGYILHALVRSQHPAMHDAAELMVNYASNSGLFAEYYEHEDGMIIPFSGTLRPWESGINAAAMAQYLLGFQPDLPDHTITLEPHLPPNWDGWETREISLYNEGSFRISMFRQNDHSVEINVKRIDGHTPLNIDISLGGFGVPLRLEEQYYQEVGNRNDIIETNFVLDGDAEKSLILKIQNAN